MQPYQEEYLANLRQFAAMSQRTKPGGLTYEEYAAQMTANREQIIQLGQQNNELLRTGLFPVLDNLFDASASELEELRQFASQLFGIQGELDVGLYCQIHQALLSLARLRRDRSAMIRELYWLGLGRNSLVSKLVGLELSDIEEYNARMRLCFTEAAAYLKYYDEIDDDETRSYILRSRANVALGQFHSPGEKVAMLKNTLKIFQDKDYQEKSPSLPWDRFVYLIHQNITSCISHSREKVMTPENMADIMESAYIVYQQRFEEEEMQGKQPPAKSAFAYYAIEYYCGLYDLDRFLSKVEALLDAADPFDYSKDGIYNMISLPAFYSQYLKQYPERIPPRRRYVGDLYRRILAYANRYPGDSSDGSLFLYLRQLSLTFVENGSVPYREFLERLQLRFAPDVFCHSHVVGKGAKALCAIILEDDPHFFDDIDFIRDAASPEEKRQAVLDFAMGCGVFHDMGKVSVIELFSRTPRQWFEDEYDMARLHTLAGRILLEPQPSTSRYAAAALGHHVWYDGSRGYPSSYKRLECPTRQMVDVICLIDWLEALTNSTQMYMGIQKTFPDAVQAAVELEGKRFSPLLTARLRDNEVVDRLERAFIQGRQDAYRLMYEDACGTTA